MLPSIVLASNLLISYSTIVSHVRIMKWGKTKTIPSINLLMSSQEAGTASVKSNWNAIHIVIVFFFVLYKKIAYNATNKNQLRDFNYLKEKKKPRQKTLITFVIIEIKSHKFCGKHEGLNQKWTQYCAINHWEIH